MINVFIDGSAGTTGLRIRERLGDRSDLNLLTLPEELRKDPAARADALNSADVAFLCLPDQAAVDAAAMLTSPHTVLIDTSTAHRVSSEWAYGFPELRGRAEKITVSKRIANPGCHASGFIALIAPLREEGLLRQDAHLHCFSLTGYSGGGKKMIAEYEAPDRSKLLNAPRQYGLSQAHKHLPEMADQCALDHSPVFCPIVGPWYAGMEVTVSLSSADTSASPEVISAIYREYYRSGCVRFVETNTENGFLSACAFAGRDDMEITVNGNADRILLTARFDNLGKGASGAAIQNMNLVLGLPQETGLNIGREVE